MTARLFQRKSFTRAAATTLLLQFWQFSGLFDNSLLHIKNQEVVIMKHNVSVIIQGDLFYFSSCFIVAQIFL